jgi:hypothetical protein
MALFGSACLDSRAIVNGPLYDEGVRWPTGIREIYWMALRVVQVHVGRLDSRDRLDGAQRGEPSSRVHWPRADLPKSIQFVRPIEPVTLGVFWGPRLLGLEPRLVANFVSFHSIRPVKPVVSEIIFLGAAFLESV